MTPTIKTNFDRFICHPMIKGGVAQTILGSKFPGSMELKDRKTHKVQIDSQSCLIVYELEADSDSPIVLMTHGMGGCTESGYMRRIAKKLDDYGFAVFMMNQRGSGPGIGMSSRLWNGGSSDDLEFVVQFIVAMYPSRPLLLLGFSLSGNILLKYLGEGRNLPREIAGAYAVSPSIDLKVSSLALSTGKFSSIFNKYYMDLINRQAEAMAECFPDTLSPKGPCKTIYEFDCEYTAQAAGFASVDDYYERCSAKRLLRFIQTPTMILCSRDDPFIPPEVFESTEMSLSLSYMATNHGGHMGFISKNPTPLGDHRWMDYAILEWAKTFWESEDDLEEVK